jgi:hypothetical protein
LIANTEPSPNSYVPEPLDPTVESDRIDLFGLPAPAWDYGWYYTPQFSSCIWVKRVADMTLAPAIEAWLKSGLLSIDDPRIVWFDVADGVDQSIAECIVRWLDNLQRDHAVI